MKSLHGSSGAIKHPSQYICLQPNCMNFQSMLAKRKTAFIVMTRFAVQQKFSSGLEKRSASLILHASTCKEAHVRRSAFWFLSMTTRRTCVSKTKFINKQWIHFDEISVTLWSSNKAHFDADCFLWCTSSGNLPQNSAEMAHFLPNELLKQLLADTAESRARLDGAAKSTYITDIGWNLNDDHSPVMMSMTKLYNISIWNGKIKQNNCEDNVCSSKKALKWSGKGSCTFMFACTLMSGNTCGDYGLVLSYGGVETTICHQNQYVSYSLATTDEIDISMWSVMNTTTNMHCFAWCTQTGRLPSSTMNNIVYMMPNVAEVLAKQQVTEMNPNQGQLWSDNNNFFEHLKLSNNGLSTHGHHHISGIRIYQIFQQRVNAIGQDDSFCDGQLCTTGRSYQLDCQ